MKRNTKTQNLNAFPIGKTLAGLFLVCALTAHGQMATKGNLYIADNGNMYIGSSAYYFESGGSTATSRTASVHGALVFNNATFNGASDSHFIDGYARSLGTSAAIFPIGQSAVYAPAKVLPSASATTDAAYFRSAPSTVGATLDSGLNAISTVEYWDVRSTATASISLTWRASSDLALLSGNTLSKLTIAGWNGSNWIEIPSAVDTTSILGGASSLNDGSITSLAPVDTSAYTAFTLAVKGDCASLVPSSGITKTWNGSWSPSAPTISDPVVIGINYFGGSFSCNSLTLNANLNLSNGQYVEVVNGVTGTGTVYLASEASFVQRNPAATAPSIVLTKVTRPMRRFDYVFLSSPINDGTAFYNLLRNNNQVAVNASYGNYPNSAFGAIRELNAQGTGYQTATTCTIGKGNNVFVRNQAPYSTSSASGSWNNEFNTIYAKIPGTANNGNVSVSVPATYHAMIGNPYPCAIDGEKLLSAAGANVRQTLYYWTFTTPTSATNTYNEVGDWATWTTLGGVSASGSSLVPNGSIASMQSVMVTAANATPTTFNITNCMKKTGSNDVFFRTVNTGEKNRYWLNLTGSAGTTSQILLGYVADATYGDDLKYDALRLQGTGYTYLSSLVDGKNFVIQARPDFEDTDIVPLGIYKGAANETFTLSLGNKDGIFSNDQQIYLHDRALGVYHNFANGAYAFTQPAAGIDNNRFEIVYRDNALGTGELENNRVIADINHQVFTATAATAMSNVQVYDLTGRKVQEFNAEGQTSFSVPFLHAQAVYIAKIKLENGAYATVKLINQ